MVADRFRHGIAAAVAGLIAFGGIAAAQGVPDAETVAFTGRLGMVGQVPAQQITVNNIVAEHRTRFMAANNELARGAERPRRAKALCASFGLPVETGFFGSDPKRVSGWLGIISKMRSDSGGNGTIDIQVGPHMTVRGDTKYGTPLHDRVMGLQVGQFVQVVIDLRRDSSDCFTERSISVSGGMEDPDFGVNYIDIRPMN